MDSVYKLTKYSQKITDACQKKQYEKIGLYNKHENLYIKKLNEYFGNQKGGATLDDLLAFFNEIGQRIRIIIQSNKELKEKEGTDRMVFDSEKLELQREINRLGEQNEELRDTKQMLEQTIGGLQDQLRTHGEEIRRITDKLTSQMEPDAQAMIQEQAESIQHLQQEVQDKKFQISSLELRLREVDTLPQLLEDAKRELDQRETKISDLTREIRQCTSKNDELTANVESLTRQISSLSQQLGDTQQAAQQSDQSAFITGLQAQVKSAQEEKEAALLAASQLAAQEKKSNDAAINSLKEQLSAALQDIKKLQSGTEVGGGRRR
jgi:chromosome segregation ATPase